MTSSKKLMRIITAFLLFLVLLVFIIFLWASSPNQDLSQYNVLIKKDIPPFQSQDSVYEIISYNIGYLSGLTNNRPIVAKKALYDRHLNHVLESFNAVDADIICLQEIDINSERSFHVNQQEAIQDLGYGYTFQAINWDEKYLPFPGSPFNISSHHGSIFSGQSIISKFPLLENKRVVLKRPDNISFHRNAFYLDRLAQHAKVKIGDQFLYLLNIHLDAYDKMTRLKQMSYLEEFVKSIINELPVLLVGDFNTDLAEENSSLEKLINIPGLEFANTGGVEESQTFPSDKPIERIDYIFYNPKFIQFISAKVLHEFGTVSDHLPVVMSFKLY